MLRVERRPRRGGPLDGLRWRRQAFEQADLPLGLRPTALPHLPRLSHVGVLSERPVKPLPRGVPRLGQWGQRSPRLADGPHREVKLRALKVGGRAAVIVPDGVLFGSSKAHLAVRKALVDDQLLEGIISMPSGVFKPYAGVSTAVLLFTRTDAGGTEQVWFYDMAADGYSLDDKRQEVADNDIPDVISRWRTREVALDTDRGAKAFFVGREEIVENGYDLSINRYKKVLHVAAQHERPGVILDRLMGLEEEIQRGLVELRGLVG